MTGLPSIAGNGGRAEALNSAGDIVGSSNDGSGWWKATLWVGGVPYNLGSLGGDGSYAYDINDSGQVVGYSYKADGDGTAFVWTNGIMRDLNDLLAPGSGWTLYGANAINNGGQIAGYGAYGGATHGYLLTPTNAVPAPGAMLLGMLGVGLAAVVRKSGIVRLEEVNG
jgi:probable HAF family extracellular repeat protein